MLRPKPTVVKRKIPNKGGLSSKGKVITPFEYTHKVKIEPHRLGGDVDSPQTESNMPRNAHHTNAEGDVQIHTPEYRAFNVQGSQSYIPGGFPLEINVPTNLGTNDNIIQHLEQRLTQHGERADRHFARATRIMSDDLQISKKTRIMKEYLPERLEHVDNINGINIWTGRSRNQGSSESTIQHLATVNEWVGQRSATIPDMHEAVSNIVCGPRSERLIARTREIFSENAHIDGVACGKNIVIYDDPPSGPSRNTPFEILDHEYGHQLARKEFGSRLSPPNWFNHICETGWTSAYAKSHESGDFARGVAEDFAESYKMYMNATDHRIPHRDDLEICHPGKFREVQRIVQGLSGHNT